MLLLNKFIFAGILIIATQSTRMIPLLLENKTEKLAINDSWKNNINDTLFFFLICYCFRDFSTTSEYKLRLLMAFYVFAVQYKYKKTLISIFTGTFLYMLGRYLS